MSKIKAFLERYPWIYKVVRKIYVPLAGKILSIKPYLGRNRLADWWSQRGSEYLKGSFASRDRPDRLILAEKIAAFSPVSNILEVGCSAGPNLRLLAMKFPDAEIRGVDPNPLVAQIVSGWFAKEGISNVRLSVGRGEKLDEFQDNSFDVVFTHTVLTYIRPSNIEAFIKEMFRIARKGLVLVEWHDFTQKLNDKHGLGVFKNDNWVRNYVSLLKRFVPEDHIRVTKIPKDARPDEGWQKFGAFIEVTMP